MRIALIITELHPGGAERCFVNLAIYLKSAGHEVAVWELWPPPSPERGQLVRELDQHGIEWHSGGAVRAWQFASATAWLRRELSAFQPDVIQSFLFHANVAAALASIGKPWPLIGGARVRQPQKSRQRLQRWAARRMHRLVCVSHTVLEHCQNVEKISASKLIVIANGVGRPVGEAPQASAAPIGEEQLGKQRAENKCHLSLRESSIFAFFRGAKDDNKKPNPGRALSPARGDRSDAKEIPAVSDKLSDNPASYRDLPIGESEAPILLFVGRLVEQKGIDFLLENVDELLLPLPQHQLVIVGDGPLLERLKDFQSRAASGSRIHFAGWQADAHSWMRRCEQLILPARYEGMPNVVLEAMSLGKPVVAFDVDGVRECLGAGPLADVQIAKAGDFDQFAAAVKQLAADQRLRSQCGETNQQRTQLEFDLTKQLKKYEALYEQCLTVRRNAK